MTIKELLDVLQHFLLIRISYEKIQIRVNEKVYDAQQVLKATENLEQWCYKDLRVDDIEKICRCKNCVHYKRYRKKGQPKSMSRFLCEIDKSKRSPDFYCADGKRRKQ